MGTNRKDEPYIKYMIMFMTDGSDIRTTLKQSFDGNVKEMKTCLAELGFLNAKYTSPESDTNQKQRAKIHEYPRDFNFFPNDELFEKFKETGSSWFMMQRAAAKANYIKNEVVFATKLATQLCDPQSKKPLIDFDVTAHKTFNHRS